VDYQSIINIVIIKEEDKQSHFENQVLLQNIKRMQSHYIQKASKELINGSHVFTHLVQLCPFIDELSIHYMISEFIDELMIQRKIVIPLQKNISLMHIHQDNIFLLDNQSERIYRMDSNRYEKHVTDMNLRSEIFQHHGSGGVVVTAFMDIQSIVCMDERIFLCDKRHQKIWQLTLKGKSLGSFEGAIQSIQENDFGNHPFSHFTAIIHPEKCFTHNDRLYVIDFGSLRIQAYNLVFNHHVFSLIISSVPFVDMTVISKHLYTLQCDFDDWPYATLNKRDIHDGSLIKEVDISEFCTIGVQLSVTAYKQKIYLTSLHSNCIHVFGLDCEHVKSIYLDSSIKCIHANSTHLYMLTIDHQLSIYSTL